MKEAQSKMLGLIKKIHRHHDELLSLMLLLSLIRIDPRTPFPPHVVTRGSQLMAAVENDLHRQIMNDVPRLHPKSVEASLARYQEELFADLNDLGRFSIDFGRNQDITAYLLDETDRSSETPSLGVVVAGSSTASQPLENVVDRGSTSLSAEVNFKRNIFILWNFHRVQKNGWRRNNFVHKYILSYYVVAVVEPEIYLIETG